MPLMLNLREFEDDALTLAGELPAAELERLRAFIADRKFF